MRLILDSCVWGGTLPTLRSLGHDAVWVGEWDADPGDEAILETALRERRILITLDKDFGELAIVYGRPHAGILRLVGIRSRSQAPVSDRVLELHGEELSRGAIVTVTADRIRVRPPEGPG